VGDHIRHWHDISGARLASEGIVGDAYLGRREPVVTERLKRAGVRLADLLNASLGE
jgi:hypothetical protein